MATGGRDRVAHRAHARCARAMTGGGAMNQEPDAIADGGSMAAVVVCTPGKAIPLVEACENVVGAAFATKKDSELEACYQLAGRLRATSPDLNSQSWPMDSPPTVLYFDYCGPSVRIF